MKGVNLCQEPTINMRKYFSKNDYSAVAFVDRLICYCFSVGCLIVYDITRPKTLVSAKKVIMFSFYSWCSSYFIISIPLHRKP